MDKNQVQSSANREAIAVQEWVDKQWTNTPQKKVIARSSAIQQKAQDGNANNKHVPKASIKEQFILEGPPNNVHSPTVSQSRVTVAYTESINQEIASLK